MAVPYTFGTATSSIPLSQLDSNFNTVITLGNTAIQLGNTVTTLNNMTLANVTISSGNVTITNVAITTANVTTANITTAVIGTETVTTSTITTANVTTANITTDNITNGTVITSLTLSYGTANGVTYLNGSKVLTSGSALTFDGTYLNANGLRISGSDASNTIYKATGAFVLTADNSFLGLQANASNPIIFFNNSAETMRLTSTGLGIGTSSPAYKLTVANGATSLAANQYLRFGAGIFASSDGSVDNYLFTGSTSLKWRNAADSAELMQLTNAGNLGLGVTPSASSLPTIEQQVGLLVGRAEVDITSNAYYNSGWKYVSTGLAPTQYQANGGLHKWFNAPSGTAGNVISFTQAMTLDSSGNLLVGTTTSGGAGGVTIFPLGSGAGTCAIQVFNKTNTASDSAILFRVSGTTVSGISYTSTVVTYGTVSDYRLKTVIGAVADSGSRIDALEPIEYTWNSNGQRTRGFLAHKFQEVYADSVTGTKDALDTDGNPVYQGMQAGSTEVIADLVAEIQSLRKRLTALESKEIS